MDPEQARKIDEILQNAMDLEGDARATFIDRACAGDHELRLSIMAMLSLEPKTSDFLEVWGSQQIVPASGVCAAEILPIGKRFGHYVVLEKIGQGGMGAVYRARDEHLERDVALKILSPDLLTNPVARRRFRREALALSKLNHPNIAVVFDFDIQDGVDFLAMELIVGSTLSELIKDGPLPQPEVVRIGLQLASGLQAAHSQHVFHRDLKPANLMITADGQLKILDFGVALLAHQADDGAMSDRTVTAGIVGTIPYMSPEQLRGGLVDARTDIYAAGAVLYEIAAGRRPFSQLQNAELIGAILHQRAAPPSTHKPQILPGFESVVMKALEKEPHKRYQSARQFGAALESAANTNPSPVWRRRFARAAVWATAVVLTALAATLSIKDLADFFNRKKPTHAATQEFGHRRSVAVLGFRNLSGKQENAWLSTAFSEMLTTELAAGEQLRTIPGESVSQMKINLSLADAEAYTKETLSKIRENLGTDDVVLGSYLSFGDGEIRVDMRLQDASDGETIVAISERGTERHIDELAARIGSAVRTKLALPAVSAPQQLAIRATLSSKPEAVRLYTQGLERLRTFDAVGAAKIFEQAITVDPEYALAHSALSRVWSNLGYDEKAKREAKRAFELSTGLSRQDRLSVEARYHVMSRELDQAIDIYRMLWEFFPENIDYGLQLAAVQITAGKGQDALTTVAGLRKLASPAAMDSRIDLAEAEAHESLSDFVSQQQCAGRAVAHSKANGMRLLEARALLVQGRAFQNLGDIGNALQAFENAQTMYQSAGDKGGAARALNAVAGVYHIRGEASQADRVFAQAVGIFREIGDRGDLASTLSNLGLNRRAQQDDPETKRVFEESVVIARDVGDRELLAGILTNFGTFLDQREPLEARKRYEQALEIFRSMGSQQGVATTLNDIGNTLVREPNLPLAKRSFEEALGISRQIGDKRLAGFVLYNLGRLASQQGDLVQGQDRLEEALSIRRQIGDKEQVAYTLRTLASVLIDAGQPSRAERLAREAMDQFRSVKGSSAEALTEAVFADTLFAQGRIVEAQGAIKPVSRSTTNIELGERLTILIIAARIQSATGEADQAVKTLQDVIFQAAQAHLIADELEGRLVLGEIELKGHDNAGGRARLVTLEKEAAAKGFLLISRKAHAAIAHVNSAALSLLSLLAMK